jgi:outer membrane protein assembly factor BamB
MAETLQRRNAIVITALVLLASSAPPAAAQAIDHPNVYLSVSVDAKQKMQSLEGFLAQKNWAEAVDLLMTLAEKQGDRLAPTAQESPSLFVNLRAYCNARIAALPTEALDVYRSRVDGQAEAHWKEWRSNRDRAALRTIVDEFFCSTVADKAVDALGEAAFAEGRLNDAVGWWMKLLPRDWSHGGGDSQFQLRCPTPRVDSARVVAKCILARALSGDGDEAKRLLRMLREKHPSAKGRLGGAEGVYVDVLGKLVGSEAIAAPAPGDDFPTFAGNERRNKASSKKADVGGLQFLWEFESDPSNERDDDPASDSRLPHFPAVVGDDVYAATDSTVWKFDLKTGKATRWLDVAGARVSSELSRARYTVTIKNRRLYLTVHDLRSNSEPRIRQRFGPRRDWHNVNSTLICYDLDTQKELWRANPSDFSADRGAVFEGSPIAVGDDLCVAVTRYDALSETSILRIDASSRKLIWKAVVCESMTDGTAAEPPMYNLLTQDDSTIYYCTNLGAVAAVNADTGIVQWAATYQRRAPPTSAPGDPSVPDLNPCVVHQGRVFALPRDGRRLICYDAETGEKQWESPASLSFSHLLGAHAGVVIATGARVCAFDVATGKLRWVRPINNSPGLGRGMIAGGDVYWPTRTDIHVFNVETGEIARPAIELFTRLGQRPGNLVQAGEYLLVAQSHRLLAYCSFSKLIERHRGEIASNPEGAEPRFKLAEALMQHGDFNEAAVEFAAAAERAGPIRTVAGRKMVEESQDRRFEALLAQAKQSPSADRFRRAFDAARTPSQRVTALADEFGSAETARRVEICQAVLDSKELRLTAVRNENGSSETAGRWSASKLQEIIARHGKETYARQDRDLADLLARGGQSQAELVELSERFPLAFTLARTLFARAEAAVESGDFDVARPLCKQLLKSTDPMKDHDKFAKAASLLIRCERSAKREESAYLWAAHLARMTSRAWPSRPSIVRNEFEIRAGNEAGGLAFQPAGVDHGLPRFGVSVTTTEGGAVKLQWLGDAANNVNSNTALVQGGVSWVARVPEGLVVAAGDELALFDGKVPDRPAWRAPFRDTKQFRRTEEASWGRIPNLTASPARFAITGDAVIAVTEKEIFAVDAADGNERWRVAAPPLSERIPTLELVDATLFIHHDAGSTAVDPLSGRTIASWPNRIVASAAFGDTLAVMGDRVGLSARDQRTGAERWKVVLPTPTTCDPLLLGGADAVLVVYDGMQLISLETRDGSFRWRTGLAPAPRMGLTAAVDGESIVLLADGALECRELRTGERRWKRRLDVDALDFRLTIEKERVAAAVKGKDARLTFALKNGEAVASK